MKIFFIISILISSLFSHKLYILADDDGKILQVKSYFTKSSACQECQTKIFDKQGTLLFDKKTDINGKVDFPFVKKEIEIEVTASMGHKNKISYESENEIISEDKNVSYQKLLLALGIIAFIFFILKVIKK